MTANELRAIALHTSGKGYAVGPGDLVVSTPDFGDTWVYQDDDPNGHTWLDAAMRDGNVGVLVGGDGSVATTADAGATWTNRTTGTTRHLRGVLWTSATTLVTVGDQGTVLRSSDSGATWASVATPTTEDLFEIDASPAGDLLAVGSRETILRSLDGGATWATQRQTGVTKLDRLNDVAWADNAVAYAAGDNERLLRSTDAGATWTELTTGAPGFAHWQSIDASGDGQRVFVLGMWGQAWRSLDGGATWSNSTGGASFGRGQGVTYHGSGFLTALTEGNVHLSEDNLQTSSVHRQTWNIFRAWHALDTTRAIAAGEGGVIQRMRPPASVPDYGGAATWSSGGSSGLFGACLQAIGGAAVADWTVDAAGTANRCEPNDTDPWRAIGTTSSTVSRITAPGSGSVDLVFGVVPAASQPKGAYRAKLLVEVVAPAT